MTNVQSEASARRAATCEGTRLVEEEVLALEEAVDAEHEVDVGEAAGTISMRTAPRMAATSRARGSPAT